MSGRTVRPYSVAETECAEASKALQLFPRGPMGLTPDYVKRSPEYCAARARYNAAFARVRAENTARTRQVTP